MAIEGKVAIVTGSGTGIGRAIALKLAGQGARVLINYSRSEADAEQTLAEIRRGGGEGLIAKGDITVDADCRALAAQCLAAWGRTDILVNNAGVTKFASARDLEALCAEDFLAVYKVNLIGVYQMVRACAPAMREAGKGAVVNISSIAGATGEGSSIAYAASKGALNTMTLSLARALAPVIRVNTVCPAFVATRWFLDHLGAEAFNELKRIQATTLPLARVGTPEDVATAVLYFCGEGSDHATGQILFTDAGHHLGSLPLAGR